MAEVIRLSEAEIKMAVGSERKLAVTLLPKDSEEVVIWSSSNEPIAIVSADGKVIGKSTGNAVITATVGDLTDSCNVTVVRNYVLVSVADAKKRLSIDFDNQDEEIQERINSIIAYITFGTGIKASDFASLGTEAQNLAKEYILSKLYYDYYDTHTELNDSRLTRIMKQLQVIGGQL